MGRDTSSVLLSILGWQSVPKIPAEEVTSPSLYFNRRSFMRSGVAAGSVLGTAAAWSMVIPWAGIQLSQLIDLVEPMSTVRYVAFETLLDPTRMPGQRTSVLQWRYIEGLRLDEAMNPLTILATGLYGKALPPQDGAPIRLVTPWKYGFKGIKSIVKISFLADQPATSWSRFAPSEHGFYANVNPTVDHPRWSQADEQRIGESGRRKTLMFNGYEEQVADLYSSMDLRKFY